MGTSEKYKTANYIVRVAFWGKKSNCQLCDIIVEENGGTRVEEKYTDSIMDQLDKPI